MRRFTAGVAIITLTAALGSFTGSGLAAGYLKGGRSHVTKDAEPKSGRGGGNSHFQWSADPERGWVRTNGSHHSREEKRSRQHDKQNPIRQRGKTRTR